MNFSDYTIQKRIRGGDIGEFERLFNHYYEPLCMHADKIVRDMELAEDIVQEFFYQFWKNRASFTLKLSLNAYLFRSIRNNALHHLEHMAVRKKYSEFMLTGGSLAEAHQKPSGGELNEMGAIINATLALMPERCARIFRMNRFEGLKYHEIAGILSVSVKTVEADMGKALQLFRRSLKDYITEDVS
jgi:RNA polymerase sigma-70 factor (ECF subfamily)